MEAISTARFLRISPMKLRRIVNMIRGKKVSEALAVLRVMPNKGAKMTYKVIHSARANFHVKNPEENVENLFVTTICVDQGPYYRRMMPRARGRADVIRKPLAHLTAHVGTVEGMVVEPVKPVKAAKPETSAKPKKATTTKATTAKTAKTAQKE